MPKIIFTTLSLLFCVAVLAQGPYEKIKPVPEKLKVLPLGAVKPAGWIRDQIRHNLDGFTGNLDKLAPDLIIEDDIYVTERLSKKVKSKDVGALGAEGDWQVQFLWWNSETQSNWRDGYIRSAILSGDQQHLAKIKTYIDRIIASQDKDGYLGIYDEELRYKFDNENGELWAKATLLRGLLAWFDYTKDPKVLTAVKRAVQNTMDGFPINASHPFYSKNENVGGLSHGLTFTDVLEELHRLTNDEKYLDYALFLYKDFSQNKLNEDAQFAKLMDKNRMLNGHGVHTYEHLRCLAAAYQASGNPELANAISSFEEKIAVETTASGGPVGDEWIGSRKADATHRGYEYCSLQELLHSYESLMAKTANAGYGDKVEKLFFNAAQGARHPEKSCIAYLKSDNSYEMTGGLNGDESDAKQTRYRYSPVHREAAVCCVPNAGRIAPYFVQYMWMKDDKSVTAALLGPSTVNVDMNGTPVMIEEITEYPYENQVIFKVTANTRFDLRIRKPGWARKFDLNVPHTEENGFIVVSRQWKGTTSITLDFKPEVEVFQDVNGEYYFSYGARVLARPIESTAEITKQYATEGFADIEYAAIDPFAYLYEKAPVTRYVAKLNLFETTLYNPKTRKSEKVILRPMGETILRQVTFKSK